MSLLTKTSNLKRYKDIAQLFMKYGGSELLPATEQSSDGAQQVKSSFHDGDDQAKEFAADLEAMGPLYIKLGQLLSSRPDLIPSNYVTALERLQDDVAPFDFAEVTSIIESELGVRLSKAFPSFDASPIAVASLGQVHRATLRNGTEVVVKVQRPGVREQLADDFTALEQILDFVDNHTDIGRRYCFLGMLEEFHTNLLRELDYAQEARNLTALGENLKEFPSIVVPQPIEGLTTTRVLTMSYIDGTKVSSLGPLARLEIDGAALAEALHCAYLKQILVDGFFHADPHPGNVFVTHDKQIALIDLGMVGHISSELQERLLRIVIALTESDGGAVADMAIEIGDILEKFDERKFRSGIAELVDRQQGTTLENIQVGKTMLEVSRISGDNGVRMPRELTILSKALLNLDGVARSLDPTFRPVDSIRQYTAAIWKKRLVKQMSPANLLTTALETGEFARELPARANKILDMAAGNQLKFKVDAFDEGTLIEGFQKVANRITMGLILAALIIGAAMMMKVETRFQLFGYPGLSMLCFLGAAGGGTWLIVSILMQDRAARLSTHH